MSSGSNQFDEANIVRDEYEIQQYGFTVDEFTKESKIITNYISNSILINFSMADSRFVKDRIKKAMRSLDRKLEHLMKDVKPDIDTKLSKTIELTASKIYKNSREDIRKINTTIETHFRIPDNVLLYGDKMYMTPPTKEDVEALEEECKQLEKAMNEVRSTIELVIS